MRRAGRTGIAVVIGIFVAYVAADSPSAFAQTPPDVTTNAASNITATTAVLNGSANPNGFATTGWFRRSTTNPGACDDTFGTRVPAAGGDNLGSGTNAVSFSESTSGLSPSTTYYFCAIAENAGGKAFGNILSFTTSASPPPQQSGVGVSVEVPCAGEGCPAEVVPRTGPGPPETRAAVTVEGYGPPRALLYILINGAVNRTIGIPPSGIFSGSITGLSPGPLTVGVFAYDTDNLTTPTVNVHVVLYEGTITRIYDMLLPPTIRATPSVVREGERVIVSGQTFPRASVRVTRDPDRQTQEVLADRNGRWEVLYTTRRLLGSYGATARSFLSSGLLSEESTRAEFTVVPLPGIEPIPPRLPGEAPPPRPEGQPPFCVDTNGDRLVNLIDFSILLYNWGVPKQPNVDCNGDGIINLIDFSVLLYWWTG